MAKAKKLTKAQSSALSQAAYYEVTMTGGYVFQVSELSAEEQAALPELVSRGFIVVEEGGTDVTEAGFDAARKVWADDPELLGDALGSADTRKVVEDLLDLWYGFQPNEPDSHSWRYSSWYLREYGLTTKAKRPKITASGEKFLGRYYDLDEDVEIHAKQILETLRAQGPMTKAELVEALPAMQETVHWGSADFTYMEDALDYLKDADYVQERDSRYAAGRRWPKSAANPGDTRKLKARLMR